LSLREKNRSSWGSRNDLLATALHTTNSTSGQNRVLSARIRCTTLFVRNATPCPYRVRDQFTVRERDIAKLNFNRDCRCELPVYRLRRRDFPHISKSCTKTLVEARTLHLRRGCVYFGPRKTHVQPHARITLSTLGRKKKGGKKKFFIFGGDDARSCVLACAYAYGMKPSTRNYGSALLRCASRRASGSK